MDPEKKGAKKVISKILNIENVFIGLVILLGIIVVINIVLTFNLNKGLTKSTEALKEKLKPAKIELAIIKNSKCSDCFDISTIVSYVKTANVNVAKETIFEFDSKEGRELIKKYNIEKIPTVVITGEIDKVNIQGLEKKENALLLTRPLPPYVNAVTGKIEGRVTLYNLKDTACEKCSDLTVLINQIKGAGVKISEEKIIAPSSDEGKELIKKYSINFAPTIILSKEAAAYDIIQQAWPNIGSKEIDGSYVLRLVNPPFINLTTGKLRGIVNIIYLTDKSCTECYNISQHKEILTNPQSFAVKLDKEETFDISDSKGKELIAKYNITQVPTIFLSDEISVYPSSQVLKQFFSFEKDGSYVFRRLSTVGTYKDLATNQVIQPQQQFQQQSEEQ
ncbi:hypothetical protein HYX00_04315 [Candidatus Woesearchaeota archaeon]|nr:hypothetical protein [Candidatus Woesearchaeota archaeon]